MLFKNKTDLCQYLLTIIVVMILLTGCHRNAVIPVSPVDADRFMISEAAIEHHLYGWQQAEILYEKEFNIRPTKEIEGKLKQLRFLILIREIEEEIYNPRAGEIVEYLCTGDDPYDKRLCEIVKWVQNGKKAEELNSSCFIPVKDDPVFENYLSLLLFQAVPQADVFSLLKPLETKKQSPLFLYMNSRALTSVEPAEFEKDYPHFTEGFVFLAEQLFLKNKYRSSREFYQKSLELIPNYTKAILGIGDIYYALDDYERALHHYNMALRYIPSDSEALFRKGLTLHQLKRHEESNDIIDKMLQAGVVRIQNKWVSGIPAAQYYQGQGYYVKAYNHYLLKDDIKSREFVDLSKKQLPYPYFPEPVYLSGVLFYNSQELEASLQEFLSIRNVGNCNVPLHIGFIYEKLDAANQNIDNGEMSPYPRAILPFLETAACLDRGVQSLNNSINEFDFSEFEQVEQERMKTDMAIKLTTLKTSSRSTVETIISRIDEYALARKKELLESLNEILSRLK